MVTRVDTVDFNSSSAQWTIIVTRHPDNVFFNYPAPRPNDFPEDLKEALVKWASPKPVEHHG
jgi:tRNA uridine 5-carbamoylmethylation protein Kti12